MSPFVFLQFDKHNTHALTHTHTQIQNRPFLVTLHCHTPPPTVRGLRGLKIWGEKKPITHFVHVIVDETTIFLAATLQGEEKRGGKEVETRWTEEGTVLRPCRLGSACSLLMGHARDATAATAAQANEGGSRRNGRQKSNCSAV